MPTLYPIAKRYHDRCTLTFPYHLSLNDAIGRLPATFRSFDSSTKTWTVKEPYVAGAIREFTFYFPCAKVRDARIEVSR